LVRRLAFIAILLIGAVGVGSLVLFSSYLLPEGPIQNAKPILYSKITRSELAQVHFGPITKFKLPFGRLANAITVADDGSVWFGEEGLPGIGHLYQNGTLVEYAWPFHYPPPYHTTNLWGIAVWNGGVWSTDQAGNQLVGINPVDGATVTVQLPENESFPYTMTIGPEGSLWFTEVFGYKIARLDRSLGLHEYPMPVLGTPGQIVFVNGTLAYYIDTGHIGFVNPGLYAFNPQNPKPYRVGGQPNLFSPTGLALGDDGVWVTQHGASSLAFYSFKRDHWTIYPTSTITYQKTTLPYFVATNGSLVWFNEHYANRIAVLDSRTGLLTEYSVSDPPATRLNEIDGALTFTLTKDRVWFTELVSGYVGFVDASYKPSFSLSQLSQENYEIKNGSGVNLTITIGGISTKPLKVQFSDSESITSKLQNLIVNASQMQIDYLNGGENVSLKITASPALTAGDYTLLITVNDGLVYRGLYVYLKVQSP
jgi:streptogramin lyase